MTNGGGEAVADIRVPWPVSALLEAVAQSRSHLHSFSCPFLLCAEEATVWFAAPFALMTDALRCCPEHKGYLEGRLRLASANPLPARLADEPLAADPDPRPDPGRPHLGESA